MNTYTLLAEYIHEMQNYNDSVKVDVIDYNLNYPLNNIVIISYNIYMGKEQLNDKLFKFEMTMSGMLHYQTWMYNKIK